MNKLRVLFIGGTERGYATLRDLVVLSRVTLSGILIMRQDAHEKNRVEKQMRSFARSTKAPWKEILNFKDPELADWVRRSVKPDIAIVVGCRSMIPSAVYTIPRMGTYGAHDSLLPLYRGFAPLNWAIINGESRTGVTLFKIGERMDGGLVFGQRPVLIGPDQTAPQIYQAICQETVLLTHSFLDRTSRSGKPPKPQKQNESKSTYTCSRTPSDGRIDWADKTHRIYDQIRALTDPYPGAFTYYKSRQMFIWKAKPVRGPKYTGRIPGRVVALDPARGTVDVLTGDGILRIFDVGFAGAPHLHPTAIIKSIRVRLGLDADQLLVENARLKVRFQLLKESLRSRGLLKP